MKRALFILLAMAAPLLAMAQPRYTVEKIPMCWTVSAVDSSVTKIVLISSVSDQLITIGYYNADGAEVTVSGGTLAYGYCGTGGGGGGGDDDWRWYVPGDDTYAQPLYRVGKTNIFVTNPADTTHGFRVDSTFQFRMDGGRDIFDWQVGGGTGYDYTPHAGLFYRAPETFEQNGLGSGHNNITIGADDSTILSRDRLGALIFAGRNPSGTGGYRPGAMITAYADGNWSADSSSTSINFYVTRPNQATMNNVVTFERGGRVELDYYQTFEDGIPERMMGFTNLSDDMTAHTITGTPGANKVLGINEYNTAMTWKDPGDVVQAETRHIVYQPAHGFILPAHGFIPVYLDTITGWELALAADSLTLHDSYIVEVISVDTFVLQEAGILRVPAGHGLTPGSDYFLTDVGGIATTPGFHNDWLATVWDTITLALKATRPVLGAVPDTTVYLTDATLFAGDVSGVYNNLQLGSGVVESGNILDGTITAADLSFTPIQGAGTSGRIPRFTAVNTLGDGTLRDDGTLLAIGGVTVSNYSLYDYNTSAWKLPSGTTAQQPTNIAGGHRFNTTLGYSETANGTTWLQSDFPAGSLENTLRWNGTSWVANGAIKSNGSRNLFGNQLFLYAKATNTFLANGGGTEGAALYAVNSNAIDGYWVVNSNGTNQVRNGTTSSFSGNQYPSIIGASINDSWIIRRLNMVGITGVSSQAAGGSVGGEYVGLLGIGSVRRNIASTSDRHVGVMGMGVSVPGDLDIGVSLYGVWGFADNYSGGGGKTGYGVYGAAINCATNWGFYNPTSSGNNSFGGNTIIGSNATPTATADINGSVRFRAISTPGSVDDGETWTSSTQKALTSNQAGINQVIAGTIFTGTSDVTVSNSNTETTIVPTGVGTMTLPANFFTAGKSIKIDMWGIWEADTIAPTFEIRAELGGTLLCTTSAQTMTTCEGGQWHAEILLTCRTTGAAGTMFSQGEVRFNHDATAGATHWMRRSTTTTHDTTASNLLDVTFTANTADPDNLITTTNITVTVLN